MAEGILPAYEGVLLLAMPVLHPLFTTGDWGQGELMPPAMQVPLRRAETRRLALIFAVVAFVQRHEAIFQGGAQHTCFLAFLLTSRSCPWRPSQRRYQMGSEQGMVGTDVVAPHDLSGSGTDVHDDGIQVFRQIREIVGLNGWELPRCQLRPEWSPWATGLACVVRQPQKSTDHAQRMRGALIEQGTCTERSGQ